MSRSPTGRYGRTMPALQSTPIRTPEVAAIKAALGKAYGWDMSSQPDQTRWAVYQNEELIGVGATQDEAMRMAYGEKP